MNWNAVQGITILLLKLLNVTACSMLIFSSFLLATSLSASWNFYNMCKTGNKITIKPKIEWMRKQYRFKKMWHIYFFRIVYYFASTNTILQKGSVCLPRDMRECLWCSWCPLCWQCLQGKWIYIYRHGDKNPYPYQVHSENYVRFYQENWKIHAE